MYIEGTPSGTPFFLFLLHLQPYRNEIPRRKLPDLDFDMEQVRGLGYFIRGTNVQDRYLSTSVREIFVPDRTSSRPISEPQHQIRRKAGALLRYEAEALGMDLFRC